MQPASEIESSAITEFGASSHNEATGSSDAAPFNKMPAAPSAHSCQSFAYVNSIDGSPTCKSATRDAHARDAVAKASRAMAAPSSRVRRSEHYA